MINLSYDKWKKRNKCNNYSILCNRKYVQSVICCTLLMLCSFLLCGCGRTAPDHGVTWQLSEEDSSLLSTEESPTQEEDIREVQHLPQEKTDTEMLPDIYVYICGAVWNPGVYPVPEGSRLYQVIEQAGGICENADETYLNLAREVADGEQIVVPTLEETLAWKQEDTAGMREWLPYTEETAQRAVTPAQNQTGLVNINTASAEELTALNGIGESRAEAIIAYRNAHGQFTGIEEIKNVDGIKNGLYEKIKDKITVE